MHPQLLTLIAAQRIADLHRAADHDRLVHTATTATTATSSHAVRAPRHGADPARRPRSQPFGAGRDEALGAPRQPDRAAAGRQATVPFVGFAEAFGLGALRKAGVPMQRVRPAVKRLNDEIGLEHALASHAPTPTARSSSSITPPLAMTRSCSPWCAPARSISPT
jgi:hypothetical protein